jgi:hypothetical protein
VTRRGGEEHTHRVLVGTPEGKSPLDRLRRRWEDNIEVGTKEVGWESVDWTHLAQDGAVRPAVVSAVINLQLP